MGQLTCECGRLMQGDRCPWFPHRTFTRPIVRRATTVQDVVMKPRPAKTQFAAPRASGPPSFGPGSLCRYGRHPRLGLGRCVECARESMVRFRESPKGAESRANRLSRPELRARLSA